MPGGSENIQGNLGVGVGWGRWEDSCPAVFPKEYKVTPSNDKWPRPRGTQRAAQFSQFSQATNMNIIMRVMRMVMLAPYSS